MPLNFPPAAPELLAPAGGPEAGRAALRYGADAVYLGLRRFSARAEADNFDPDELACLVARARARPRPARVYVALNTLLASGELADASAQLHAAIRAGADGFIVQDLAAARLARRAQADAPARPLRLHASTQMSVHNAQGCRVLARMGFDRAVLAREMTLDEIARASRAGGLETEVFIHGALCYSVSGLCLFSSLATGRSGNRGRCAYPCRAFCRAADGRSGHFFSMKDLDLHERVGDLVRAGAAALKIEGRKKSPLYVSVAVDIYRRLLDGTLPPDEWPSAISDLQTVFARPATRWFLDGARRFDAIDPDIVGPRGAPCGTVEAVVGRGAGRRLRFTSIRPLERHDGLQIDIPGESRPYGFAITALRVPDAGGRRRSVFGTGAAVPVSVETDLPPGAPGVPSGAPVYCSSSQAVKRRYADAAEGGHAVPAAPRTARAADAADAMPPGCSRLTLSARLAADGVYFSGSVLPEGIDFTWFGAARPEPADDPAGAELVARAALARFGATRLRPDPPVFDNPERLFLPPGVWNALRRALAADLSARIDRWWAMRAARAEAAIRPLPVEKTESPENGLTEAEAAARGFWSVYVDRPETLDDFADNDWKGVEDVVVALPRGVRRDDAATFRVFNRLAERAGTDRLRLALPILAREDEAARWSRRAAVWQAAGWRRWLVGGLWGLDALRAGARGGGPAPGRAARLGDPGDGLDIALDWPLHTLNPAAWAGWLALGATRATASLEMDAGAGADPWTRDAGARLWTVVYQDAPLFLSLACAHAHIRRGCRGGPPERPCPAAPLDLHLDGYGDATVYPLSCGSVVAGRAPYSLSGRLGELIANGRKWWRVDFLYRPYTPKDAVRIWRRWRAP